MAIPLPFLPTLRTYSTSALGKDLLAGLTVAIVALPQSMAYAIIAGLDPVYGIYTAIVSAVIGSLMGSSNHLITGPTNAISLLVASGLQRYTGQERFLEVVALLTLLAGLMQIFCGLVRMGKMINFVSHSVIVGFTCGAGVIIALGQLNSALGVPSARGYQAVAAKVWHLLGHLDSVNPWTAGVSAAVIGLILLLKRINKNLPGPLIALLGAILASRVLDLSAHGVKLTGAIPCSLPVPHLFPLDYETIRGLFSAAIPIAIIGLVEAISIAKSIGSQSDQKIDANQEFLGQGLANTIAAFFQCYPGSGSFTRSAINYYSGAATRFAGVFSGLILAALLFGFAPFAQYMPKCSLAAVIILIGIGMVNPREIRKVMAASRSDSITMWVTFGATILMPDLDWAIYMGVFISIALYLRDTNTVPVRLLVPVPDGSGFCERELGHVSTACPVLTIHIEGNLYFGVADDLERKLESFAGQAQVYILRLKRVTTIDLTALEVLDVFVRRMKQSGATVLLCGVRTGMHAILENTRLAERIGAGNIYLSQDELFDSTRQAYERALSLTAQ